MKSIRIRAGSFAVIISFFLFLAACADSPTGEEGNGSAIVKSDTAVMNREGDTCILDLTFLDGEGNALAGGTADIVINDVVSGTLSADKNGAVTVEDIPMDAGVDVTVYDENGNTLAVSRIYVYTANISMYTENSDGVLYLYIEEGVDGLSAIMQINDEGTFDCVDLVS